MRRLRDVSKLENPRVVRIEGRPNAVTIKHDPVEPEPVGTYVALVFRIHRI
jgi:hypothetical protein